MFYWAWSLAILVVLVAAQNAPPIVTLSLLAGLGAGLALGPATVAATSSKESDR